MLKKSSIWLIAILSLLVPFAAACGSLSNTVNSGNASNVATHGNLYVLAGSTNQDANALQIVSFQPGASNLGVKLPNGLASLDHQHLYTAVPQQGHTTISVIDTRNASVVRSFTIDGTYSTAGTPFDHAVLSFDGHWLALRALSTNTGSTTIALLDTRAGTLLKTISLQGDFNLDAVSPDASRIYLLERLHDGTSHYYVRLYQVDKNQLYEYPIVDKNDINDPNMTGMELVRQMSADGSKVFTLYIDPHNNVAFIHILPLTGDYLGARCIDLPAGSDPSLLHYYTLAMHTYEDGHATLYAANGALGSVTTVDIDTSDQVFSLNIGASAHFAPTMSNASTATRSRLLYNGAAISPDNSMLFFAGLLGIWSVKTSDLARQNASFNHYLSSLEFTSLGFSSDGKTLYAVNPAKGIMALDAGTCNPGRAFHTPVAAPWGIEWIAS